jgi:hypothetical protein
MVIHDENEAYRLFNLGTDVAHDVTMTVNYPDEWLLDLPRRRSPRLAQVPHLAVAVTRVPDFVLVSWREHPELLRVPLPSQS